MWIEYDVYGWKGIIPPQHILSRRRFKGVVLNPPDFNPGSWIGAGSVIVDYENHEFWLAVRARKMPPSRGYAAEIYRSTDGENYGLVTRVSKEEISSLTHLDVLSIEGVQLLRNPADGKYHFYLSIDVKEGWDTLLLTSDDPAGPWESKGIVLKRSEDYDRLEARDSTIGIVDGKYFAIYKANSGKRVNVALATSSDGIKWRKHGIFRIDGEEQPQYFQLYGNIFAGSLGPIFMGLARRYVVNGCGIAKHFEAYIINYRDMILETIYRGEWTALSQFEMEGYPTHGYANIIQDPFKDRILIYTEAIDPEYTKEVGWRTQVDRLILYETKMPK